MFQSTKHKLTSRPPPLEQEGFRHSKLSFSSHGARSTEVPASCGTARWPGGTVDGATARSYSSSDPEVSWPGLPSTFTWASSAANWKFPSSNEDATLMNMLQENGIQSKFHPDFWVNESRLRAAHTCPWVYVAGNPMEVVPIEPPNAGSTFVASRLVCLGIGDQIVTLTVEHQGFGP